ncbi:MAG: tetratricopeptide repeat protein [Pleurocapsa minor GSE-CHR-MK-17-07R]|nr:tetratricopeptide repeat protein [Pleurocapsa minor GSE-CHR-MK 17-07R]
MRSSELLPEVDLLLIRGDAKRAEVVLARLLRIETDPRMLGAGYMLRARARLVSTRIDSALEDLRMAVEQDASLNGQPEYLELLGDCYLARYELVQMGFADRADTAAALETYERIEAEFPDYENLGWVQYQHARLLMTQNRPADALHLLELSLLSPALAVNHTSYCYERLGFLHFYENRDLGRALGFLNKAIDTYPTGEPRMWLAQVYTLRGRVLRDMMNLSAALSSAEMAVSIASQQSAQNRLSLADAAFSAAEIAAQITGRERDVIGYVQQFTQASVKPTGIDVTWSRAHEMLGDAYWRNGQGQPALAAYLAALQYNPYHPWELSLYYRVARCYYAQHDYAKAIAAVERMLATAEKDGEIISDYRVYHLAANAYYAHRNYAMAAQMYQSAISLAPQETTAVSEMIQFLQMARAHVANS